MELITDMFDIAVYMISHIYNDDIANCMISRVFNHSNINGRNDDGNRCHNINDDDTSEDTDDDDEAAGVALMSLFDADI